eukprot:scaffold334050_cov34-Prasinocladus_malaysianus.AAC.1
MLTALLGPLAANMNSMPNPKTHMKAEKLMHVAARKPTSSTAKEQMEASPLTSIERRSDDPR